jgi:predicted anti-sigma-YlaC factor YlaD
MKQKDRDLHERAQRLIDVERVEGLAAEERRWLEAHLTACEACAGWATETDAALRMLRSVSIAVPHGLAASANLRVRQRALDLRQRRARNLALIVGCTLSWAAGVASAPLVWQVCAWLGSRLDLPRIVWQLAFVSWWFVPTAAGSVVILMARARSNDERKILDL